MRGEVEESDEKANTDEVVDGVGVLVPEVNAPGCMNA